MLHFAKFSPDDIQVCITNVKAQKDNRNDTQQRDEKQRLAYLRQQTYLQSSVGSAKRETVQTCRANKLVVVSEANRWMLEKRREPLTIRMVAHDCAYVHVAFNGCRRATEKGKRRRQGGYVHVAIVVNIVDGGGQHDGGVVILAPSSSSSSSSSSSGATPGTVGREEKREMTGWKGERRGAEACPPPFEGQLTLEWKPEAHDRCFKRDEV
ncbi:hypothetical protein G5I_02968 [Acromyrmex echinatior]|uniref:Uncharacterized protein n=1 Tax=Acromyrmex echinatior TaxID=103372 RepID=F4WBP9_ACREC|nr:hypothetical protein G5I_02968 [Acromyrmex echinatior]